MLLELNLSNKFCNELKWTVQVFFFFWFSFLTNFCSQCLRENKTETWIRIVLNIKPCCGEFYSIWRTFLFDRITLLLVVFQMADIELVKKMLRAVLQANKGGISLPRLQSEYKELTGEQIPHKQMGYNHLDALLASMPSLVHMERSRSGEVCDLFFVILTIVILLKLRKKKKPLGTNFILKWIQSNVCSSYFPGCEARVQSGFNPSLC